jgi:hypothetical protein
MFKITHPVPSQVTQRDNNNEAMVEVRGTCDGVADRIEVRFIPCGEGWGIEQPWYAITPRFECFAARVPVKAGWYRLEARQFWQGQQTNYVITPAVGVGEVFMIFGHSIAQGGPVNTKGAEDERVVSINASGTDFLLQETLPFTPGPLKDNGHIGPFGGAPYAWSMLGDMLVKRLQVPVMFYGCAFGGTSIEHNYKTIKRIPFEHGFCRFNQGQPYRPIAMTLQQYVPRTGVRAVLCQHGINDSGLNENPNEFLDMFRFVIRYTREQFCVPDLAWVVTREDKPGTPFENIKGAIKTMLGDKNIFVGPDFSVVTATLVGRPDSIHLTNPEDCRLHASNWDGALTAGFFAKSKPVLAASNVPEASVVG